MNNVYSYWFFYSSYLIHHLTFQIVIDVEDVVTVDKANPDTNYEGDDLDIGKPDGSTDSEKRVIVKFNVDSFDTGQTIIPIDLKLFMYMFILSYIYIQVDN